MWQYHTEFPRSYLSPPHLSPSRLRGQNLFEHVIITENLPEQLAAYFMEQLLSAMEYLHNLNVVHLAIKVCTFTDNVFMNSKASSQKAFVDRTEIYISFSSCRDQWNTLIINWQRPLVSRMSITSRLLPLWVWPQSLQSLSDGSPNVESCTHSRSRCSLFVTGHFHSLRT